MNRTEVVKRKRKERAKRNIFTSFVIILFAIIIAKLDIPSKFEPINADINSVKKSMEFMSNESPIELAYNIELKSALKKHMDLIEESRNIKLKNKTAYLIFDVNTYKLRDYRVLENLKNGGVKANFLLRGEDIYDKPTIIRHVFEDGHRLGNAGFFIDERNSKDFRDDIEKTENILRKIIADNYKTKVIRKPKYIEDETLIRGAIAKNGYRCYEGNALNDDLIAKDDLLNRINNYKGKEGYFILIEDGKEDLLRSLPDIIDAVKSSGYRFGVIE